jgi:hypothetical protein
MIFAPVLKRSQRRLQLVINPTAGGIEPHGNRSASWAMRSLRQAARAAAVEAATILTHMLPTGTGLRIALDASRPFDPVFGRPRIQRRQRGGGHPVTEEEARLKWCPLKPTAPVTSDGREAAQHWISLDDTARWKAMWTGTGCIASDCMMWRVQAALGGEEGHRGLAGKVAYGIAA